MKPAYTLIEMLIVIGVLAILTGLASLSVVSFGKGSDIDSTVAIVSSALQEARANSLAEIEDQAWGLQLEPQRVVLYGGGVNQVKVIASQTNLSWNLVAGGNTIEFSKRTGQVTNEGTITIKGQAANQKTIVVNQEGMIE